MKKYRMQISFYPSLSLCLLSLSLYFRREIRRKREKEREKEGERREKRGDKCEDKDGDQLKKKITIKTDHLVSVGEETHSLRK
jgi:hypothetical protein